MSKPLVIDLCCGLGGWTKGFLFEGWDTIGFDIERHVYGDKTYPGELILKSILEINGYDLRAVNPVLVVASPPCQEFSYMAMPWKRGKQIAGALRGECPFPAKYTGSRTVTELTSLYDACFRIARQIGCPIVLENVKGAQPWMGRANAHFGSYYLWGDVADVGGKVVRADRPQFGRYARAQARRMKGRTNFHFFEQTGLPSPSFHGAAHEASVQRAEGLKGPGGDWFADGRQGQDACLEGLKTVGHVNKRDGFDHTRHLTNQRESDAVKCYPGNNGTKFEGASGAAWFDLGPAAHGSQTSARKAASAMIAEIPFELASYVARTFDPRKNA